MSVLDHFSLQNGNRANFKFLYAVVVVIDVVVVFVVAAAIADVVVASAAFVVLIEKYCSISFNLKTKKDTAANCKN